MNASRARRWFFRIVSVSTLAIFLQQQILWAGSPPLYVLANDPESIPKSVKDSQDPFSPIDSPEKKADSPQLIETQDFLQGDSPLTSVEQNDVELSLDGKLTITTEVDNEFKEYDFDEVLELIRPEFSIAIPVKSITEQQLAAIRGLEVEVAFVSIKGSKFLLTSGKHNEIHTHEEIRELLDEADFIAHTHPAGTEMDGPSLIDMKSSTDRIEYLLTPDNISSYNQEGISSNSVSNAEFLSAWDAAAENHETPNDYNARLWANRFIVETDRLNWDDSLKVENFRASGTVSPDASLTSTSLTNFSGSPWLRVMSDSSAGTTLRQQSSSQFTFNYDVSSPGSKAGALISFDNPTTSAVEVRNFSTLTNLVVGLQGPLGSNVRFEVEDSLGGRSDVTLINIGSSMQYYKISKTLFTGIDWTKVKLLTYYIDASLAVQPVGEIIIQTKTLLFSSTATSNLPNAPYLAITSDSSRDTSLMEQSSGQFKLNYDVTQNGSIAGGSVVLDNPATSTVEVANFSTWTQFTFGISGPANGKLRVEFEDSLGTKASVILSGVQSAMQYFSVAKNQFSGLDWTKIKKINFMVDSSLASSLFGTMTIQIKTLTFSTAVLTNLPATPRVKILEESTPETLVRQGTNASFALDFSLSGIGTKSAAAIDFDNSSTAVVETQNLSAHSQFVFSAGGIANGKVRIEIEDVAGAKASTVLSGLLTASQYFVLSASLFEGVDLSRVRRIIFSIDPSLTSLSSGTISVGAKSLLYSASLSTVLPGNPVPIILENSSPATFLTAPSGTQMKLNYDVAATTSSYSGLSYSFDNPLTAGLENADLSQPSLLTLSLQGGASYVKKIKLEVEDSNGTKVSRLLTVTTANTYLTLDKSLMTGIDWANVKRLNFIIDRSMLSSSSGYKGYVHITFNGFQYTPTVLPTTTLTSTSVSTLPASPSLFLMPGSSDNTSLAESGGKINLTYDVNGAAAISGARINFDKSSTSTVETVNLSAVSNLVFGLSSPVNTVRMEIVDVSGVKSSIFLTNVVSTEKYFRVYLSSFSKIDKTKIKAIQFIIDPVVANNAPRSGVLNIFAKGLYPPALSNVGFDAVNHVTTESFYGLSGSKGLGTGIAINGNIILAPSDFTSWQARIDLPSLGEQTFQIQETNGAGVLGPIKEVKITRNLAQPEIKSVSIEDGAILDIPYLAVSYAFEENGISIQKYKEVDLEEGLNNIELKEIDQAGNAITVHRRIYYVPQALDPVLMALRSRLIEENARYFQESQGIDPATGFPIDVIGPNAPESVRWTQPTSIGFYLQFLGEIITKRITVSFMTQTQALEQARKVLNSLLQTQSQWGWNGLLPWLEVTPVLQENSSTVALIDNANLTHSLAAFSGALSRANLDQTLAQDLSEKAELFLTSQREGYLAFVDPSNGLFRANYNKATVTFDGYTDRFGSEVRSSLPFLIQYFGVPSSVWNNLIRSESRYVTEKGRVVETFSAYDGGGFQYFWPLLNSPEETLPGISAALQNALLIHQDFMKQKNLPGFASAASLPEGGYSGKVGINHLKETVGSLDEGVGSVYSLAAAYRLNPAFVLEKLQELEIAFPNLKGPLGFYDAARSNNSVSQNYYAIDQGSIVLGLAGNGASDFKHWMQKKGLWQSYESFYNSIDLGITQSVNSVPEPDLAYSDIDPSNANSGNIYSFRYNYAQNVGNGISVTKLSDGTYRYSPQTTSGWIGGTVNPPINLQEYSFVNISIRNTASGGGFTQLQLKNGETFVLKRTIAFNNNEWQQIQFFLPKTTPPIDFIGFAQAFGDFEVRDIRFDSQPVFLGVFPPSVSLRSNATTNQKDYLLQYEINGVTREETISLSSGLNTLARRFKDTSGREHHHEFHVTYDGGGPVVLLVSNIEASTSSYVLAYTVDGVHKEESVTLEEGENLLIRTASDSAGNTTTKTFRIVLDSEAPVLESYKIDQGNTSTKSPNVTLNILAYDLGSTVSEMSFSNDGVNFTAPEAYNSIKNWTLTDGKGEKKVWVKLKDAKGRWSEGQAATIFYEKAHFIEDFDGQSLVGTFWDIDGDQVYQRGIVTDAYDGNSAMKVDFQKNANMRYSYFAMSLNGAQDFASFNTLRMRLKKVSEPPMVLMAKLEFDGSSETFETQISYPQGSTANWQEAIFDFSSVPPALLAKTTKILFFVDPGHESAQGSLIIDAIVMDERSPSKIMDDFEGNNASVETYWDWDGTVVYQRALTEERAYDGTHSMKIDFQKKPGLPYSFFAMKPKQDGLNNNFSNYDSLRFQLNKGTHDPMVIMMKLEFNETEETFEQQIHFPQGSNSWQEAVFDFSSVKPELLSRIKNVLFFVDPASESTQGTFYIDRLRLAERPSTRLLDDFEGNNSLVQTYWDGDGPGTVYMRVINSNAGLNGTRAMHVQYGKTAEYATPYFGLQPKQDGIANDFSKYNVLKFYVNKTTSQAMKLMVKFELEDTQINFEAWKELPEGATGWIELVYDFSSLDPAIMKKVRAVLFFVNPVFYSTPTLSQGSFYLDSIRLGYESDISTRQFDPILPPQLGWAGSSVASDFDNEYRVGSLVRVNAWELNAAGDLLDGTVRIVSSSTGYDSGEQKLIFLHDGQHWPFHWDTTGLQAADDYKVMVTFKDKSGNVRTFGSLTTPALTIKLTKGIPPAGALLEVQDFSLPVSGGFNFSASRSYDPMDAQVYDHQPGLGWHSSFDIFVQDFPDGTASLSLGAAGYQFFFKNPDGTYRPMAVNNYSTLTKKETGFEYKLKDGTVYELSSAPFIDLNTKTSVTWFVTRIVDRNNNEIRFLYDENRNPVSVLLPSGEEIKLEYSFRNRDQFNTNKYNLARMTDSSGRVWAFEHDVKGNLISETNPLNQKTLYQYDSKSRLEKIVYPDASTRSYQYDTDNRVTKLLQNDILQTEFVYGLSSDPTFKVKDALGRISSFTVSLEGNISESVDAAGAKTQYFYDARKNRIKQVDAQGNVTLFSYDDKGNLLDSTDSLGKKTTFIYEPVFSLLKSETNAIGNMITYDYDVRGNLLKVTDPALNTLEYIYDLKGNLIQAKDPLGYLSKYTYDPRGLLLTQTNPLSKITTYSYDSKGNPVKRTNALNGIAQFQYDVLGRIISDIDELGRKTSFTYDIMGRLIQKKDALNNIETYEYDNFGRLIKLTDALGGQTSFSYDVKGNLLKVTNAMGNATNYTYDSLDRVTQIQDALGRITMYEYDSLGRKVAETDAAGKVTRFEYDSRGLMVKVTLPNAGVRQYTYDDLGRVISETDALGGVKSYTYDSRGNLATEENALGAITTYEYNKRNELVSVKDALLNVTQHTYDAVGNLTKTTHPDNTFVTFQYDALNRLTSSTDELNRSITYAYNAIGKVTRVTDPAGNFTDYQYDALNRKIKETDALGKVTSYTYDALSRMTKITDAKLNVTSMSYDSLGRLLETAYPDFSRETFTYDSLGNIAAATDRMGRVTQYTYDFLNRLTGKTFPDGSKESRVYDAMGNLLTITNQAGTVSHEFDLLGRMTKEIDVYGNSLAYTYDAAGNRKSVRTTIGGVVLSRDYSYDTLGRLTEVKDEKLKKSTYTYDSRSRVKTKLLSNGTKAEMSYNAASELISITHKNAGGTAFRTLSYGFNNRGLIANKTDSLEGQSTFAYDKLGRLVSITHPVIGLVAFTLDAMGNRSLVNSAGAQESYSTNSLNEYNSAGSESFTYNANGDMTFRSDSLSGKTSQYQYDFEDRLTKIILSNGTETVFVYDAMGRRVSKTVNGVTTRYVWDGSELLAETDAQGKLLVSYAHGIEIDEVLYQTNHVTGEVLYFHQDHLMSTLVLTTSTGALKESYTYDVYGNMLTGPSTASTRLLYTGREWDKETELYYNRARFYDPGLGRFISSDPKGYAAGLNLYAYTLNNPLTFRDPEGTDVYWGGGSFYYSGYYSGTFAYNYSSYASSSYSYSRGDGGNSSYINGSSASSGSYSGGGRSRGSGDGGYAYVSIDGSSASRSGSSYYYTGGGVGSSGGGGSGGGGGGPGPGAGGASNERTIGPSQTQTPTINPSVGFPPLIQADSQLSLNVGPYIGPAMRTPGRQGPVHKKGFFENIQSYIQRNILIGPENTANQFISNSLTGAEAVISGFSFFMPPAGPLLFAVNTANFINEREGGPSGAGYIVNALAATANILSGNPILTPLGIGSLAFYGGSLLARTRIPGTVDSTWGDIYADFFTAPNKIRLS